MQTISRELTNKIEKNSFYLKLNNNWTKERVELRELVILEATTLTINLIITVYRIKKNCKTTMGLMFTNKASDQISIRELNQRVELYQKLIISLTVTQWRQFNILIKIWNKIPAEDWEDYKITLRLFNNCNLLIKEVMLAHLKLYTHPKR